MANWISNAAIRDFFEHQETVEFFNKQVVRDLLQDPNGGDPRQSLLGKPDGTRYFCYITNDEFKIASRAMTNNAETVRTLWKIGLNTEDESKPYFDCTKIQVRNDRTQEEKEMANLALETIMLRVSSDMSGLSKTHGTGFFMGGLPAE